MTGQKWCSPGLSTGSSTVYILINNLDRGLSAPSVSLQTTPSCRGNVDVLEVRKALQSELDKLD